MDSGAKDTEARLLVNNSMRDNETGRFVVGDNAPWTDRQTLHELYTVQGLSAKEVGSELGCSAKTIRNWLGEHNIPIRSPGPGDNNSPKELRKYEVMWDLYHVEGLGLMKIADRLECHRSTVQYWLEKHGIERRDGDTRSDNPSYYGPNWPRQRKKARQRDGFECRLCGVGESNQPRELDVHHKIPFREFVPEEGLPDYESANALDNLITVCRPCHRGIEPSGGNKAD